AVTLGAAQTANSLTFKSGAYTIAASTLTISGASITVDPAATVTITSTIAGSSGITKNGLGALQLTASNSYTGGTTLNAGALRVGNDNCLGAGGITFAGGTFNP